MPDLQSRPERAAARPPGKPRVVCLPGNGYPGRLAAEELTAGRLPLILVDRDFITGYFTQAAGCGSAGPGHQVVARPAPGRQGKAAR